MMGRRSWGSGEVGENQLRAGAGGEGRSKFRGTTAELRLYGQIVSLHRYRTVPGPAQRLSELKPVCYRLAAAALPQPLRSCRCVLSRPVDASAAAARRRWLRCGAADQVQPGATRLGTVSCTAAPLCRAAPHRVVSAVVSYRIAPRRAVPRCCVVSYRTVPCRTVPCRVVLTPGLADSAGFTETTRRPIVAEECRGDSDLPRL